MHKSNIQQSLAI